MELRSCSHWHFISAVKGGYVIKTLNVFRGRPALNIKQLTDIYENDDSNNQAAFPIIRPTHGLEEVPTNHDKSQAESSSTVTRERTEDTMEFFCTSVINEIDADFSCMTLKQVKERCKEKKRKYSKVGTRKKGDQTTKNDNNAMEFSCTSSVREVKSEIDDDFGLNQVKERCKEEKRKYSKVCRRKKGDQNCITNGELSSNCNGNEDDFDGMETLSSFRSKLPKKMKKKRSRKSSDYLLPSYALTIVKSEEIPTEQVLGFNETFYPIAIKTEHNELCYSDCENSFKFNEFSSDCTEPDVSDGVLYLEWPGMARDDSLQIGMSKISCQDSETGKVCIPETEISFITKDANKRANGFGLEEDVPMLNVPRVCFVNEGKNDHIDPSTAEHDSKVIIDTRTSNEEELMVNLPKVTNHQFSGYARHAFTIDSSPRITSLGKESINATNDDSQQAPSIHEMLRKSASESQVPLIATCDNSHQSMDPGNKEYHPCLHDDGIQNDGSFLEASVSSSPVGGHKTNWNPTLTSDPNGYSVTGPCIDGQTVSTKTNLKSQQTPHRLFCNRKTISPTSQQRLCKAMELTELDDEQYYKYTRKLCYSKLAKNKIAINGANRAKKVDVNTIQKQNSGEKFYKNRFYKNGILKDPIPDHAVQHITSGSTSIRSCSESAITFSQQQLHDAQSIATKLMTELKAMKEIANQGLQYRENTASANCNVDEVREAIQNATRVEEATRKCLSAMARDCNRFCKIMRLTGEASSAPENPINKAKKRKIAFADESGGKLCDVKTFETSLGDNIEIVD